MIELMQLAERQGFEFAWTYDSHILWQDSYGTLPLAADRTERIKSARAGPAPRRTLGSLRT
jgi:alkanesulfonate monooxygenase SsuD/methylene tetrahydromethanopterin reductase-like flavin-dependent oxidoreductase (luciferase family)